MKSPSGDTARALPLTESLKSPVALSRGVSPFSRRKQTMRLNLVIKNSLFT